MKKIAAEINAAHDAATKAVAEGAAHAMRAGELLLAAKAKVCHGQWVKWQKANLSFSVRTAQTYMQLARLDPQKRNGVADLALRRAMLKIQADQRAERILEERAEERAKYNAAQRAPPQLKIVPKDDKIPSSEETNESPKEEDLNEDPDNYRTAYLLRADQARLFATYSGPITQEIVDAARAVAKAWNQLAQKLESNSKFAAPAFSCPKTRVK